MMLAHEVDSAQVLQDVQSRLGDLSADEHSALYGMAIAHGFSMRGRGPGPADLEEMSKVLAAFRTAPCPHCGLDLREHSLDPEDSGIEVRCHGTQQARPSAVWIAGPVRTPAWRVVAGIALWGGIPAASLGLASWLMPLVSALIWRDRRWAWAASFWALASTATIMVVSTAPTDSLAAGLGVLGYYLGSIAHGTAQVKRWLRALPQPRPRRPRSIAAPASPTADHSPRGVASGATGPRDDAAGTQPGAAPRTPQTPGMGGTPRRPVPGDAGHAAPQDETSTEPKIGIRERMRRFRAELSYNRAHEAWRQRRILLHMAQTWAERAAAEPSSAQRPTEFTLLKTDGALVEPRREPGRYTGGSSGISVPLGMGIRGRIGGSRGTYTPGAEVQAVIDEGQITVTTRRVVFAGPLATREWRMDRLVGDAGRSGRTVLLPVTNRQKTSGVRVSDPARLQTAVLVAEAISSRGPHQVLAEVAADLEAHEGEEPTRPAHVADQ